jgi:TldD protein
MLGKKIASDEFTIYSDPTRNEGTGFYKYDSEGTPGRKVALIKNGVFKSYMHSRESAATCGVKPTGNARAQDYSYDPIIRMNNLYVDNRDWKFEEIIEDTKYGILTMASGGGMEDPERGGFQFNVGSCYLIEAGEVTAPLRDTSLSGATLEAFMGVDAVGNEFELWGGTCGKGEPSMQMVMNSNGGSTIRVNSIIVGGSA